MIICSKCGAPNPEINLFCKKCHYTFPREKNPRQFPNGSRNAPEIRRPMGAAVAQTLSRPAPEAAVAEAIPIPRTYPAPEAAASPAEPAAPVHPPRPKDAPHSRRRPAAFSRKALYAGLGAVAAAILLFAAYRLLFPGETRTAPGAEQFYSRAEQLYGEQQYSQARQAYQQFLIAFPGDALASAAKNRIDDINAIFQDQEIEKKQQEEQVEALMAQAKQAFERRQYLAPPKNNAVVYLQQVLAVAPDHPGALEMQKSILDFYREKATAAEKNRRYREAQRYYENVLAIQPNDAAALAQLKSVQEALAPRRAPAASPPSSASLAKNTEPVSPKPQSASPKTDSGSKAGGIAATKPVTETPKTTSIPPKTATQTAQPATPGGGVAASQAANTAKNPATPPKTEPQSIPPAKPAGGGVAASQAANTAKAPATSPKIEPQSTQPAANTSTSEPASQKPAAPAISQTTPAATTPSPAAQPVSGAAQGGEIAIVTDALVTKEYLHKEKPVPPADFKGAVLVLAECIVGTNGEVESVTVISAGNDPRLSDLTVAALKKYRYKPASHNGNPVRFKTIEAVKFAKK